MREVARKHFEIAKRRGGRVPDWELEMDEGKEYEEESY